MTLVEDGFVIRNSGRADLWPASAAGLAQPGPVTGAGLQAIASETPEPLPPAPAPPQDRMATALAETVAEAQKTLGPEAAAWFADAAAAVQAPAATPQPDPAPVTPAAGTAAG